MSANPTSPAKKSQNGFHCFVCKRIFSSKSGLRRHKISPNHDIPPCKEVTHEHQVVEEEFSTMEEAKEWFFKKKFDKLLTVFTSRVYCIRYQCRHSRIKQYPTEVTVDKTIKYPTIPAFPCQAKLTIGKIKICQCPKGTTDVCQNQGVMYKVQGCTSHSHDIEVRHNRIPRNTKAMLTALLEAGIPKNTILERYCSFENYKDIDEKIITSLDLRNIERNHVNKGIDRSKMDYENLCQLFEASDFRGFSFADLEHDPSTVPDTISDKIITNVTKSMIVYSSEEMLSQFRKFPVTLFVDGTHGTNKSKYSLISFLVADARGEGVPIMIVIGKTESKEIISPALEILQRLAPEAVSKVKVLVSDMAPSFINAWNQAIPGGDVRHVKCAWHLQNAWKRELLPQNLEFYQSLCRLRLVTDVKEFWVQYYKIRHD